jgi:hypothetical protein
MSGRTSFRLQFLFWGIATWFAAIAQGTIIINAFWVPRKDSADFFQEWSSARSYLEGRPVYGDLPEQAERYLGPGWGKRTKLEVNGHPPSAILLGIPFAWLEFWNAFHAWNVISLLLFIFSLWLVAHGLGLKPPRTPIALLQVVFLVLTCGPLIKQFRLGQLNLVLLPLIVGCWAADRAGRGRLAGGLLGIATALKLFPGFLLLYFLARRRWQAVVAFSVSCLSMMALAAAVFGLDSYHDFWTRSLPFVSKYRAWWSNASLPGFFAKLFDPVYPRNYAPWSLEYRGLAKLLTVLAWVIVVITVLRAARRARPGSESDRAFGHALTGMLLVSPVTWDHGLLLLLLPLALLLRWPPKTRFQRGLAVVVVVCLWSEPIYLLFLLVSTKRLDYIESPGQALALLSYQTYALVALFWLEWKRLGAPASSD